MSVTRVDIAEALDTIEGLSGSAMPPRNPVAGQAWPEWDSTRPSTMTGDEITWRVYATLPSGSPDAAILEADELVIRLIEVLEDLGDVSTVEPATLIIQQAGAQGLPCITATFTTV